MNSTKITHVRNKLRDDSELMERIRNVEDCMHDNRICILNGGGAGTIIYDYVNDQEFCIEDDNNQKTYCFPRCLDEEKFILLGAL